MKVHFIAIGGSAMHNLAIALKKKGFEVSGSDDEILEPSRSRLGKYGILPPRSGWFPEKIHSGLDAVILGMHARADNPELKSAVDMGLRVYSYPEYIYEQSQNKTRVVIAGSHGKTSITAMILHVMRLAGKEKETDYMVGAQLEGFDTMVKITDEASVIVLEGDEYLSSPVDRRPKFHLYKADIALLSGIAWDHINVFPAYEDYVKQFRIFAEQIPSSGMLIYCGSDPEVKKVAESGSVKAGKISYGIPEHTIENGISYLLPQGNNSLAKVPLSVFGNHNLMNIEGARLVCSKLGVGDKVFYDAITSFKGASRRLELVGRNDNAAMFRDFAHSPSKLKATTEAVKMQFPGRKLVACMELHTFSSLNENFLKEYNGSMAAADVAIVYFNPHTLEHKKLKPITASAVAQSFGGGNVLVYMDSTKLTEDLKAMEWKDKVLLMMSSGNFDGIDFKQLSKEIL